MMKSPTRLIATLLVQLLTISTIAAAATIHVPANQPTIQAGIDAANNGDTVQVANGTYTGTGNRDIDFKGKAITLKGNPNDPAQVTIDCQGTEEDPHRGFIFQTNETEHSVLDGMKIKNGYALYDADGIRSSNGGAIYIYYGVSPTITNCIITDNSAASWGGGIAYSNGLIANCTITRNSAKSGGGLYNSSGTITNCTISNNYPSGLDGCHGDITNCYIGSNRGDGLVDCHGSITNCIIRNNIGDGLYNCDGSITDCTSIHNSYNGIRNCDGSITNCKYNSNLGRGIDNCDGFIDNCASNDNRGRGIVNCDGSIDNCTSDNNGGDGLAYCDASVANCTISGNLSHGFYDCDGSITNCIITGNLAYQGGGLSGCDGPIANCIVSNNTADKRGGGLFDCDGSITNCTITANSVQDDYGSGSGLSGCSGSITNCIIWGNTAQEVSQLSGSSVPTYSCIQDWTGGGTGNISQNPLFAGAANGDYRVKSEFGRLDPATGLFIIDDVTSPCIDTGSNTAINEISETDIAGNLRIIDGDNNGIATIDKGAHEAIALDVPILVISKDTIRFIIGKNDDLIAEQTFVVSNYGNQPLNWSMEYSSCDWLTVSHTSGTITDQSEEVTLSVDATGLDHGIYECLLTISGLQALNSPQVIKILFSYGGEIHVPEDYPTIQAAIDYAVDGYNIIVANGIYTGDGNCDIDFKGKAITVKSANGPDNCIIDCQGTDGEPHRGFIFQTGETNSAILEGITVTNGYSESGGGVYCINDSSPTVNNCVFFDGHATHHGGGLAALNSAPKVYGCAFKGNSAWHGAAIYLYKCPGAEVFDCSVIENSAQNWCGGISIIDSSAEVKNCQIIENYGYYGGSALLVYNYSHTNSAPKISGCIIAGNLNNPEATHETISIEFIDVDLSANPITNCTIVGNRIGKGEGGIIAAFNSNVPLENCILANNSATGPQIYLRNSTLSASYCSIEDIASNDLDSDSQIIWGTGNISLAPRFADSGFWDIEILEEYDDYEDPVWRNGDYHLKSAGWRWDAAGGMWVYDDITSPCIDTGNPGMALGDELTTVEVDPDNNYAVNKRINMGAYGGTAEASMAPTDRTLLADINNDHIVNTYDLAMIMESWLTTGTVLPCDLSRDTNIDTTDFALLAGEWQDEVDVTIHQRNHIVAHWPFDIDGSDSVGENFGILKNGAAVTSTPGEFMIGLAGLKLDGIDDSVRVKGYKGIVGTAPRTVSAWIKTSGSDENMAIVSWGTHGVGGSRFLLHITSNGTLALKTGGDGGYIESASPVDDAQWHHVALTMPTRLAPTGEDIKLYVDGFEQPYSTRTDGHIDTGSELDLNVGSYNGGSFFDGFIDDVKIYDYQMTASEIEALTSGLIDKSLKARWTFDTDASDTAGENHGQLVDDAQINSTPGQSAQGQGALELDGFNDHVTIPGYKGITGPASRTVMAWIKSPDLSSNMAIVSWGGELDGQKFIFKVVSDGTVVLKIGGDGGGIGTADSIDDNQWHHIALVIPAAASPTIADVKIYIDGYEQAYAIQGNALINTGNQFDVNIGSYNGGIFFNGLIDDVRIYNYQLTDAEIADLAG